ncbi:MAG: hypothetical protein EOM37_09120 [Proteobacteria bacterium]|jgi:predicted transglutaminase-like cysteine proteinase|nr:transglutaminase-like cysteine peptidase [Alphaproteobacteria bacterium]NCC04185.1 hypothetical protein [Pseudomonadota bacterium]
MFSVWKNGLPQNNTGSSADPSKEALFDAFNKTTENWCRYSVDRAPTQYNIEAQYLCGYNAFGERYAREDIKPNREIAFNQLYASDSRSLNYAKDPESFPDIPGYTRLSITNPLSIIGPAPTVDFVHGVRELRAGQTQYINFEEHADKMPFADYLKENYKPDMPRSEMSYEQRRINSTHDVVEKIKGLETPQAKALAANYFGNTALIYDDDKIKEMNEFPDDSWVQPSHQILKEGDGVCVDQSTFKLEILKAAGFPQKDLFSMGVVKENAGKDSLHSVAAVRLPEGVFILNNNAIDKDKRFNNDQTAGPSPSQEDKAWAQKLIPADQFFGPEKSENGYTQHNSGWSLTVARNFGTGEIIRYKKDNNPARPAAEPLIPAHVRDSQDLLNLSAVQVKGKDLHDMRAEEPRVPTTFEKIDNSPTNQPRAEMAEPLPDEGPSRGAMRPQTHQPPSQTPH